MIIKYKYSPLLFIDTLHAPIPVLFCIWFFFGHKGTDASHPLMLILALWDDWSCHLILAFQALYYMSEIMEERLSFHQRRPHLLL